MAGEPRSVLREGIIAGLIGAAVVAVWFFVYDIARGHPFRTPTLLGSFVFFGAGIFVAALVVAFIGYGALRAVKARGPVDIVRWLENGLVDALASLGFPAVRRDTPKGVSSLAGVWTPDQRKVASIGMRIRRGVTSHGFALDVDPDMTAFHRFTACGLADVTMVSLAELAAEQRRGTPSDAEVRDAVFAALTAGS